MAPSTPTSLTPLEEADQEGNNHLPASVCPEPGRAGEDLEGTTSQHVALCKSATGGLFKPWDTLGYFSRSTYKQIRGYAINMENLS